MVKFSKPTHRFFPKAKGHHFEKFIRGNWGPMFRQVVLEQAVPWWNIAVKFPWILSFSMRKSGFSAHGRHLKRRFSRDRWDIEKEFLFHKHVIGRSASGITRLGKEWSCEVKGTVYLMILMIVGWYSQQLGSSSRCSFFFFLILIILRSQCQWPGMQKNSFWSISTMDDSEALSEDSSRGPDGRVARESHMAMKKTSALFTATGRMPGKWKTSGH
jgi:hypothetical protein